MTYPKRSWMGLTLAVVFLISAPSSASDRVLLEQPLSKTVCPGADLKVADEFDQYVWYGGSSMSPSVMGRRPSIIRCSTRRFAALRSRTRTGARQRSYTR